LVISINVSSAEAVMNSTSASNCTGNGLKYWLLANLAYVAWLAM